MTLKCLQFITCSVGLVLLSAFNSRAALNQEDQHVLVAMRMIGHELLLNADDSLSRVLPVTKEGNRYKIEFESPFSFDAEQLIETVDDIVRKTNISEHYIAEMEACETKEVVYNYEINQTYDQDLLPCKTREHPEMCYTLFITLLDVNLPVEPEEQASSGFLIGIAAGAVVLGVLFYLGWGYFFRKKKQQSKENSDIISIGRYRFNKRNMVLSLGQQQVELTGKEADLLSLLQASANHTLERETILKNVWGDEGDYVGRTLDVFISKLRKRLEEDTNIKILNIRGVGYKLVLNAND